MIHTLLQPLFILVFLALVFSGYETAGAITSRDTLRTILFGIVVILALLSVVMTLFSL